MIALAPQRRVAKESQIVKMALITMIGHGLLLATIYGLFQLNFRRQPPITFAEVKLVSQPTRLRSPAVGASDTGKQTEATSTAPKTKPPSKRPAKIRTPDEIRRSMALGPVRREAKSQTKSQTQRKQFAADKFYYQPSDRIGEMTPITDDNATVVDSYYQAIERVVRSVWDQPNRSEITQHNPTVMIQLRIDRSGAVIKKGIVEHSGVQAMDRSVERLLSLLDSFPPFPEAVDQATIELRIALDLRR